MTIRSHISFPSHLSTKFIQIDTSRCQACWKCVQACPNHVLGKTILFKHQHAHVDHAKDCKGCKKCVRSCPEAAIRYLYVPASRESRSDQEGCRQIGAG